MLGVKKTLTKTMAEGDSRWQTTSISGPLPYEMLPPCGLAPLAALARSDFQSRTMSWNWGEFGLEPDRKSRSPRQRELYRGETITNDRDGLLELVTDLVRPEAFEPDQSLVQNLQVVGTDAAHLLQRAQLTLV